MGRNEKDVATMYGEEDLSLHPMFQGGFINFGYWKGIEVPFTEEKRARSSKQLYDAVFEATKVVTGERVLEVGCGRGLGLRELRDRFVPRLLVGLDASAAQVERTRQSGVAAEVVTATAEDLPFDPASFDKILSVEALQHFLSPERFASEVHRVLASDGRLGVTTFFLTDSRHEARVAEQIPTVRDRIDRVIGIAEFHTMLRNAGLEVESSFSIGEHVWEPLDLWLEQAYPAEWGRNWVRTFREGLLDYYVVVACKA